MVKDLIKSRVVNAINNKWTWIIGFVIFAFCWQAAMASANYYELECSDFYSGYCSEGNDCYTQFGDDGINFGDYCFYAPDNPHEFSADDDPSTAYGQEEMSDQLSMLISSQTFLANVIGFWLPFSVILGFCMMSLFALLLKFGFFRKY